MRKATIAIKIKIKVLETIYITHANNGKDTRHKRQPGGKQLPQSGNKALLRLCMIAQAPLLHVVITVASSSFFKLLQQHQQQL